MIRNPARTLVDRVRGIDWINAIPAKWKAGLLWITEKTPGVDISVLEDELTGDVVSSSVKQDTINERKKETTTLDPTVLLGTILHGQEYDEVFDIVNGYEEHLTHANEELGQPRRIITPLTANFSEVHEVQPNTTIFDTYLLQFPGTNRIFFPEVLDSVRVVHEKSQGSGSYSNSGSGFWTNSGSWHVNIKGTSQASAAIIPDVALQISEVWQHNVPTTHYMFFLRNPVNKVTVLARLTTLVGRPVLAWPSFRPVAHTLILRGERLSLQVQADHAEEGAGNGCNPDCISSSGSLGVGSGSSKEVGLTVKTVRIPPTIHGAITILGDAEGSTAISASTTAWGESRADSGTVASSCFPSTLPATGGATDIPTSGLRLVNTDASPYKYGYVRIHAEVVDFADVIRGVAPDPGELPVDGGGTTPHDGSWSLGISMLLHIDGIDNGTGTIVLVTDTVNNVGIDIERNTSDSTWLVAEGNVGSFTSHTSPYPVELSTDVSVNIRSDFDAAASLLTSTVSVGQATFHFSFSGSVLFNQIQIGSLGSGTTISRAFNQVRLGTAVGLSNVGTMPPVNSASIGTSISGTTLICRANGFSLCAFTKQFVTPRP